MIAKAKPTVADVKMRMASENSQLSKYVSTRKTKGSELAVQANQGDNIADTDQAPEHQMVLERGGHHTHRSNDRLYEPTLVLIYHLAHTTFRDPRLRKLRVAGFRSTNKKS
jgi:hypothetical protein